MKTRNKLYMTCFFTCLMSNVVHSEQLLNLKYDEANGDAVVAPGFSIRSVKNPAERVPGILGNAFRSDGYSTWVTGAFNPINPAVTNQFSVSTWIALESYPSTVEGNQKDSALLHQVDGARGFLIGINTYGEWWFTCNVAGQAVTLKAPGAFPLYNWTQVSATVDNGLVKIYLNGAVVAQQQFASGNIGLATNVPLVIGRSNTPQQDGVFEVNAINAAYDNTKIYNTALQSTELDAEYQTGKLTAWRPSIEVPKTRFADDILRPRFHAMPQANWTNEPHGLVKFNNQYHMFYQRTPNGPFKWMMHWGHMVSDDLIHWEHLKDAFAPAKNDGGIFGLGSKGIWSGDVVVENNVAHAYYTTVNFDGKFDPGVAWATSSETKLENWVKKGGIIDKNAPNPGGIADFRDPYVFKVGARWHMIIGAAVAGGGGLEHYTASTLGGNWARASVPFTSLSFNSMDIHSAIWEMPVFSFLGKDTNGQDKYVLVVSPIGGSMNKNTAPYVRSVYWTGTWNANAGNGDGQFVPDFAVPKNLDVIHGHLSPTIYRDEATGNLTAIGIVDERTNSQMQNDLGWAHTYSLPRNWFLLSDGKTLGQAPVSSLDGLRIEEEKFEASNLLVTNEKTLDINGSQLEIKADIDLAQAGSKYGVVVAASPDRSEYTRIYYDGNDLVIDKSHSTKLSGMEENGVYSGSYDETTFGKPESFRVYVDHSVITVFINNKAVFENRIYPSRADSTQVALFSEGTTKFKTVTAYKMKAADYAETPEINVTSPSEIIEHAEGGVVVTVKVKLDKFTNLSTADWKAVGFPAGVTISSVAAGGDDTTAKVTLSGNSTNNYEVDNTSASIEVAGNQLVGGKNLNVSGLKFTAIVGQLKYDFESGSLNGWCPSGGDAFTGLGITSETSWWGGAFNHEGTFHYWGFNSGGDTTVGQMRTGNFVIGGNGQFSFKIAGGNDINNLYLAVVRASDNAELFKVTGANSETYETKTFDATALIGQTAYLKAVDSSTGGFGHINLDAIRVPVAEGTTMPICSQTSSTPSSVAVTSSSIATSSSVPSTTTSSSSKPNTSTSTSSSTSSTTSSSTVSSSSSVSPGSNYRVYDFEAGDLAGWTSVGNAFSVADISSATTYWGGAFNQQGSKHLWGFQDGGDAQTGTITTDKFILGGDGKITFLLAGGSDVNNLYVTLVRVSDGKELLSRITGNNTETYTARTLDASAYIGEELVLKVVDNATGGFGHLNIDNIRIPLGLAVKKLILDFESGTLNGWTLTGDAFSAGDVTQDNCFWNECISFNKQGTFHLWGFKAGGDVQTGEMRSQNFVLAGSGNISLMIGGGNDINSLYVALVDANTQQELKITGTNSETYSTVSIDGRAFVGRTCYLKVVDRATGGWGHLNLDNIQIPVN